MPRPVHTSRRPARSLGARAAAALTLAAAALSVATLPAAAHGFTSTVYAEVTTLSSTTVRTVLSLEYDLLVVSVAENEEAPQIFEDGMDVWKTGEEKAALDAHADEVVSYVSRRFQVTAGGEGCAPERVGGFAVEQREGVPYAVLTLDHACPVADEHEVRSGLFPDDEGYVRGTTTIVEYDVDGARGSAALTADEPVFSTGQSTLERFGEFFVLGAEHLLFGLDHVLFLLALVVGSRRLRDVVLAATAFTLAHSVTFVLAAIGLVSIADAVVEPVIALSIAVVAAWHLWSLPRSPAGLHDGLHVGRRGVDRASLLRIGIVFLFGLIHGLGFAGALGIDEPFSWDLLWSLLVFNLGIEVVQVAIIVVLFPVLTLLRRRAPRVAVWIGGALGTGIAVTGLVWFVQRVLGLG